MEKRNSFGRSEVSVCTRMSSTRTLNYQSKFSAQQTERENALALGFLPLLHAFLDLISAGAAVLHSISFARQIDSKTLPKSSCFN